HRDNGLLTEQHFQRAIVLERRRSERSGKPFLLMLLESDKSNSSEERRKLISEILSPLSLSTRETDVLGWYKQDLSLGMVFTEIKTEDKATIGEVMRVRMTEVLRNELTIEQFGQITITFHLFPEDWDHLDENRSSNPRLYPDLLKHEHSRTVRRVLKR